MAKKTGRDTLKGTLAILLAVMSYGMYGVYSRVIGTAFGPFSQNWLRNLLVAFIIGVYYFLNRREWG